MTRENSVSDDETSLENDRYILHAALRLHAPWEVIAGILRDVPESVT